MKLVILQNKIPAFVVDADAENFSEVITEDYAREYFTENPDIGIKVSILLNETLRVMGIIQNTEVVKNDFN